MPFSYFERLSPSQKAVYTASDGIRAIRLYRPGELAPEVAAVREALDTGMCEPIASAGQRLCDRIAERLGVRAVVLEVLEVRPRYVAGELHGLYERSDDGPPRIRVWMRTAKRGQVVAFRTFLRTLLHELCHHLDLELLRLPASMHTEGFFKRETSLFHQLVAE